MIIIILLIILLFLSFYKKKETFQYVKNINDKYKAVQFITVKKKNILVTIPVNFYYNCEELCRTTPNCTSFNYALNDCSLYKEPIDITKYY